MYILLLAIVLTLDPLPLPQPEPGECQFVIINGHPCWVCDGVIQC